MGNSSEEEVKSLLFLILSQVSMEEQTEEELVLSLRRTYHSYLNYKKEQERRNNKKDYEVAHIVFGASVAGSLRNTLKEMGVQEEEKIICFSDNFSIGPLCNIEEKKGLSLRHKWFISHINMDEEYLYKYQHSFKNTILELKDVSDQTRIMIWACENSDEQTAQRFILSLLKNKKNDIFLINLVGAYKEIFAKSDSEYFPLHTGELSSEELNVIYEKNKTEQPLTLTERKRYEQEWEEISNQSKNLRIWKDRKIHSVGEDYYDRFIINTAKALHKKHNNKDFMKSARLIGEIIGHLNQKIGDEYFEYRLIQLVLNGVFEIEGVPKAMRFYSVKLHEKYRS